MMKNMFIHVWCLCAISKILLYHFVFHLPSIQAFPSIKRPIHTIQTSPIIAVTKPYKPSLVDHHRRHYLSSNHLNLDVTIHEPWIQEGEYSTSSSYDHVIAQATDTLTQYDQRQQQYMKKYPEGMGGGTAALNFLQKELTKEDRQIMRDAILTLTNEAHRQRSLNARDGRIMLGICAQNVNEGLMGLKSWVPALSLPRGLLHGMDVDGTPIPPEELGSIYIKYNTGGCMTFTDMRKTGMGFDALWRPGDCVLEMYDGDFRGVYFSVELKDSIFRQFGVLPTDLFLDDDDDDDEDW
jgi:hypothetical protein